MFKNLFHSIFGSFFRTRYELSDSDRQEVLRMISEAESIAGGSYLTDSSLPEPVIPERRKSVR